jgi:diphthine synthase
MLYIIGLGIGDEGDISLKGLETCKKSGEVFAELYTAKWQGSLEKLGKIIGKKIKALNRQDLEEGSVRFVKQAKGKDVALLVPGDPLTATTHLNLLIDAKKFGVKTRIIHSSSILTAVAETGLNLYNFGKTATVVKPEPGYAPTSFYDAGVLNKKHGMHTLFLLDIDMDTSRGLLILLDIEKNKRKGLLSPDTKILAATGLGTKKTQIKYDKAKKLLEKPLPPPAVLIIPGKLHFIEKEFLDSL